MSIREIEQLAGNITGLGAPLPPKLEHILQTRAAIMAAAERLDPGHDSLGTALRAGEVMDMRPTDVVALVASAGESRARAEKVAEAGAEAIGYLCDRYEQGIRNRGAGDDIIETLRPMFDEAASGLTEAASILSPDDTAESILSRPDAVEAVAAWQTIDTHRRVLTAIFAGVLVPLVRDFGACGSHDYASSVQSMATAFLIDGSHRGNPEAAQATLAPHLPHANPGGGWHKLLSAGWRLRLNTPAEARAICDEYDAANDGDRRQHLAEQAALQAEVDEYFEIGNP